MENEGDKSKKPDIQKRTFDLALAVIKCCKKLDRDQGSRIIAKQLLRSGTSIGANIQEAQGAQSKADFIAKVSIAHKEVREALYWLRLIAASESVVYIEAEALLRECEEIRKIISSILLTSKYGKEKKKKLLIFHS